MFLNTKCISNQDCSVYPLNLYYRIQCLLNPLIKWIQYFGNLTFHLFSKTLFIICTLNGPSIYSINLMALDQLLWCIIMPFYNINEYTFLKLLLILQFFFFVFFKYFILKVTFIFWIQRCKNTAILSFYSWARISTVTCLSTLYYKDAKGLDVRVFSKLSWNYS